MNFKLLIHINFQMKEQTTTYKSRHEIFSHLFPNLTGQINNWIKIFKSWVVENDYVNP